MKPSPSSSHFQLSSTTSYTTHIIFGNWKGLKSIGYVLTMFLIMNEESQPCSGSSSMSNTGTRSCINPLTMVQWWKSLSTRMTSFTDENAKKLWLSACWTSLNLQKSSRCLTLLSGALYIVLLSLRSTVSHPHWSRLVMIREWASLSYGLSHHSVHSLYQWRSSYDEHSLSWWLINTVQLTIYWMM